MPRLLLRGPNFVSAWLIRLDVRFWHFADIDADADENIQKAKEFFVAQSNTAPSASGQSAEGAAKPSKEFTEDDVNKRVAEVIAERSKDGAFVFHDPKLDADLNLVFEQIKIVRGMEGYGWFANAIFHDKDVPKKQYVIDFWLKPEGDKLTLMDIRVQKGPSRFRFRDVLANPQIMGLIFQDFVFNFYRLEQKTFTVKRDQIRWRIDPDIGFGHRLMPSMSTDVSMISDTRTIIIECIGHRPRCKFIMGLRRYAPATFISCTLIWFNIREARDRARLKVSCSILLPMSPWMSRSTSTDN